ncbi:MAG: glgA, partial [Armatimonadetes bacterium]|nr:glgA [Armatimonadota bacterium]
GSQTDADEVFVRGLRRRLEDKGLGDQVRFFPNVDRAEKIRILQGMSVLSVPATYGEAFGLYLIEALAVGVPLVQPRHAAFPEVIEATGGGLLCEPDDPRSLAAAIEELLSDPARARRMGEQGRQVVLERFSIAKMTDDALAVFEQVTRQRREPVPTAS